MFDNENMGGGAWMWFLILILLFSQGGFGFGGNSGNVIGQKAATTDEVYRSNYEMGLTNKLNDIQGAISSSAYENAALINGNTSAITMSINNLSHQLSDCCCNLRSQMLQDKYDDVRNQLNLAQIASANAVQTDNILGTMGRWYANQPYPYYNPYGTTIA